MIPHSFTTVNALQFFLRKNYSGKGDWFSVSVADGAGTLLTRCIGSGVTIDQAKAAAIGNLVKAIAKIAEAKTEEQIAQERQALAECDGV